MLIISVLAKSAPVTVVSRTSSLVSEKRVAVEIRNLECKQSKRIKKSRLKSIKNVFRIMEFKNKQRVRQNNFVITKCGKI